MKNNAVVDNNARKLLIYKPMTFGEWLRNNLAEHDRSNAWLAKRIGVSSTYIGNLVRDYSPNKRSAGPPRPSEDIVGKIAVALGKPIDEARKIAGYSSLEDEDDGLYAGWKNLSPERQVLARKQIRAILESLAEEDSNTEH